MASEGRTLIMVSSEAKVPRSHYTRLNRLIRDGVGADPSVRAAVAAAMRVVGIANTARREMLNDPSIGHDNEIFLSHIAEMEAAYIELVRTLEPDEVADPQAQEPVRRGGNGVWEGSRLLALAVEEATASRIVAAMNEVARTRTNQDGPYEIDLDGYLGSNGVRYIGKFMRQPNGKYVGLADVNGSLCRVEVSVRVLPLGPSP
jgi:hypothetical protein